MKNPRIYEELAAVARDRGYGRVTAAAVHDWRRRGLLPHPQGLTRRPHTVEELPAELLDPLLDVCHYRYDEGVRELGVIGLLLWLDGHELPTSAIRSGLAAIGSSPKRLVASAGSRARNAYQDEPDADIEAAAAAVDRHKSALAAMTGGTTDETSVWAGAHDGLQVALGRMEPIAGDAEAASGLASLVGLDRAVSDRISGETPWLEGKSPGFELLASMANLFGAGASAEISSLDDQEIAEIREIAVELVSKFEVVGPILALGFPAGTGGLGILSWIAVNPSQGRPLIAYAVARNSEAARKFNDALGGLPIEEWRETLGIAEEYIQKHPEIQGDIRTKGLIAILDQSGLQIDN